MSTKAWFPTYIYYAPLQRAPALERFNRELLAECHQLRDYDLEGQEWSRRNYPGGFTSYGSLSKLHKFSSTFGALEKKITRHVRKFIDALEYDVPWKQVAMTDCWLNIMPRHSVHGLHLHPLSLISGTYYVRAPRGSSAIKFEDPRLSSFMATPARRVPCRPENRRHVSYPARAGHVVLFESWLRHEVPPSQTDEERVSISFNYHWW